MAKLTKRQKAIAAKVEAGKAYTFEEAASLLAELSAVKFTESFDVAVNLGVDPVSYTHLTLPTNREV